ncbi:MAG: MFS transporter [Verrucomicrobia bacterium]|nr:MFS transporter [Verrucomicrobiota bacterium]
MNASSGWRALRNPTFSRLWFATVISGTCVSAHETAATWMLNASSGSTFLISLMSTAGTLPFFLFILPAGALADIVERKKVLVGAYTWSAVSAGGLAILGWLHLLTPYVILAAIFLIATGFAFNAPAFSAAVTEIVSNDELPSASTLTGLQLNISAIAGPAFGGVLLALVGANTVFTLNAVCFLLILIAIAPWKPVTSRLPLESFLESVASAIRYVRYSRPVQIILFRNAVFSFFISAIPALLPVVGLKELHLSPSNLGLLFTSMGIGSVVAAVFILPRARTIFSPNDLTRAAAVLGSIDSVLMAVVRDLPILLLVAALAGIVWTVSAAELWVAAQRAMPGWARGRMNATVIMVSQGAMALGGILWGTLAATAGVGSALLGQATLLLAVLALTHLLGNPWSIDFTLTSNLEAVPATVMNVGYKLLYRPQPKDGPVLVTVEFQVNSERGPRFIELMREIRVIELRSGAYSWQLFEDPTRLNTFRMEMMVPSWTQYLLQQDRMTKADREIIDAASSLHVGPDPPEVRMYLGVNKELLSYRRRSEGKLPVPNATTENAVDQGERADRSAFKPFTG